MMKNKKDYSTLKIEIDMVSGKIFSTRGKKPSSTKSANTKHMNLLKEIFQPKSAKNHGRIYPKSLSRSKYKNKLVKKSKRKFSNQNSSSLSRSYNKKSSSQLSKKVKNSNSRKYLKEKFTNLNFYKNKKSRHRSLSGSRRRKEQYLTGKMAHLKKKSRYKLFNKRKKSDWISDAYISKFSKTKREMIKSKLTSYGVKSFREWKKDRSKKPKRITSDSRGIIFFLKIVDSRSIRSGDSFKLGNDFVRNLDEVKMGKTQEELNEKKYSPSFVQRDNDMKRKRSNKSLGEGELNVEDSKFNFLIFS